MRLHVSPQIARQSELLEADIAAVWFVACIYIKSRQILDNNHFRNGKNLLSSKLHCLSKSGGHISIITRHIVNLTDLFLNLQSWCCDV